MMKSPIEYLWYHWFPPPDSPLREEREARKRLARRRARRKRSFRLNEELVEAVHELAARDRRPEEDVVNDLVTNGLASRLEAEGYEQLWATLTEREKQVAALVCQDHSYQQIADQLMISPATVKSHTHGILAKFGLSYKVDLVRALAHWDLSEWGKTSKP